MRRFNLFRVLSRRVRQASLSFRQQRVHVLIDRAAQAAQQDQMYEVCKICRQLAPKTRRERVCIRGSDGRVLEPSEQFAAIHGYFSQVISHPNPVGFTGSCSPQILRPRSWHLPLKRPVRLFHRLVSQWKWQSCVDVFATCAASNYARGVSTEPSRHSELTDCNLVLMPKPGKSSKLPSDLRPLGIQGPTSKIVAGALRARLEAEVEVLLGSMPQYAYSKGKSIDEYICRVGGFCKEVRARLQPGVGSAHSRREGQVADLV